MTSPGSLFVCPESPGAVNTDDSLTVGEAPRVSSLGDKPVEAAVLACICDNGRRLGA